MYKGSLIFLLIQQIVAVLVLFSLGAVYSSKSSSEDTLLTLFIIGGIELVSLGISSWAIYDLESSRKNKTAFNNGLSLAAGIIGIFTATLGGLMTIFSSILVRESEKLEIGEAEKKIWRSFIFGSIMVAICSFGIAIPLLIYPIIISKRLKRGFKLNRFQLYIASIISIGIFTLFISDEIDQVGMDLRVQTKNT